ncbi:MAG: radical SAM protein [Candidatus Odinarchaeota archaeon]
MKCSICGSERLPVSGSIGVCRECILKNPDEVLPLVFEKVNCIRLSMGESLLNSQTGLTCFGCGNNCKISEGGKGVCGLFENRQGRIIRLAGMPSKGLLDFYYDALPTNCVADFVCPAGTGCGYPKYAYKNGPEYGYYNLAVFYRGCNFNCLFCQNWHHRPVSGGGKYLSAEQLAGQVNDKVACICYFGGDPTPQLPHSIEASRIALQKAEKQGRILRVCWETNGGMNRAQLKTILSLALKSGGIVKFDLKFYSEPLNLALCGVSNKTAISNFQYAAEFFKERSQPPLIVVSTPLIPGYTSVEEVEKIASLIASVNPDIPYRLLGFTPNFQMSDLPSTSKNHALKCLEAARQAGCKTVNIGNYPHLSDINYNS